MTVVRERTASIVLPDGYANAAAFARDCGVELVTGWVLVPDGKERLPKVMFDAGAERFKQIGGFNPYSIYKAMLAAVPPEF